jgi:3D (Asp-Asp-Asp) domain-containing protein
MKSNNFFTAFVLTFTVFALIGFDHWANQQIERIDQEIAKIQAQLDEMKQGPDLYIVNEDKTQTLRLVDEPKKQEPTKEYIGKFTVTAYCPCEKCCGQWSNILNPITASGAPAVEGITVGADWSIIPKGTVIEIEGLGERIVQDKPAKWIVDKYDGKILDLYFSSHEEALKFGKQELEVWVTG